MGAHINLVAAQVAQQTMLTFYDAQLGEAGPATPSPASGVRATFAFYGPVAMDFGTVFGAGAGAIDGAIGRFVRNQNVGEVART
ncbi:MAG: hypothetical protein ACHQ4H_04765 [Ktedonobacterales bacterium]